MEQSLIILGRQPSLGLAELENLYGSSRVQRFGEFTALVDLPAGEIDFNRLGGSVKLCKVINLLDEANWNYAEKHMLMHVPELISEVSEGKLQLGVSAYGFPVSAQRVTATGLSLKKAVRKAGRSVRITPNQAPALSSAQVFHNHLTGSNGRELVLANDGKRTAIALTASVQDIDSYTLRDRGRPKRDTRVGMLPPKLAQIIINLAVADTKPTSETLLLDPFCGTGVVLQEALLMGFSVYGTDIETRMVEYTGENLDWLDGHFNLAPATARFEQGDATSYQWDPVPDSVACESYLGRPFTTIPSKEILEHNIADCNLIIKKFLRNIATQLPAGARLCIGIPAWQIKKNEFKHLPLVDQISEIGYNRVSFEHTGTDKLLYYREDQVVARELLVLTTK